MTEEEAGLTALPERRPGHNHVTRDIKPYGQCPACDSIHEREVG